MRSRGNRVRIAVLTAALAALLAAPARAQTPPSPPSRPDTATVAHAMEQLKKDPNLATGRSVRVLRFKVDSTNRFGSWGWLRWILGFFRWVSESARALVWVAAAALLAMLGVYLSRTLRDREKARAAGGLATPTHVQDLDIRPESLPDDIGAAARALWDRGERRAALALLYRGLLSRLAHVHSVPIRDSTTEGACVTLAAAHLSEERHEYVARLVRLWQRSVYGGQDADTAAVYSLCTGFTAALDAPPPAPVGTSA